MGVKDLWNILSPLSDRRPLFELQGKTIAIDLSCWVVDSQNVTNNMAQPKMYLRNLFFRTSYFLLNDIRPVFVLEGTAPNLKHKTIAKRNELRHGREEPKRKNQGGRSRFNHVLKECETMLKYMGITCIKGYGEAEAMCAYLNEDGLVDGCISQDSDCFLYGAKVVYRNFCTATQGARTTSAGSIDEYSIEKINEVFNLGRNKMIAMALLCGCDYDDGLSGVGKEATLKFFKVVEDNEVLDRLKSWKRDSKFREMENQISNPDICTNCGHYGKMRSHTKVGCIECGTSVKCSDSYKEKRVLISNELALRKKALLVDNFPNQELIDEFLVRKGPVPSKLDLQWKKPMIVQFVGFMEKTLQWEPEYAFAKIFPVMTRWQLTNLIELPIQQRITASNLFAPDKIKKIRNIKSVASYEILWLDQDNILEGLALTSPNSDKENDDEEGPNVLSELVSIEPQELVRKCYPSIVEQFEELKNAKKKKPVRNPRKKKADDDNNRKISEFVKKKVPEPTLEESFGKMCITPKRRKKDVNNVPEVKKRGPQFDKVMTTERLDSILNGSLEMMFNQLTPEDFASDVDDSVDISMIIDNICNNKIKEKSQVDANPKNLEMRKNSQVLREIERNDIVGPTKHKDTVRQQSFTNDDNDDEFDIFDKTYVPLDMRLNSKKKRSTKFLRHSLGHEEELNRFSIGIDSLLNASSSTCESGRRSSVNKSS